MRARLLVLISIVAIAAPTGAGARAPLGGSGAEKTWNTAIPDTVIKQYEKRAIGRYLVRMEARTDLKPYANIADRDARRRAIVTALRKTATESQADLRRMLDAGKKSGVVASYHPFWVANVIAVQSTHGFLRGVARHRDVRAIEDDRKMHVPVQGTPSDGGSSWNVEKVGAPAAWGLGIDGSGVVVGSIDTGVDPAHPEIASKFRGLDGNVDHDWWDAVNHESLPYDDHGHGTHVTGTMTGGDGPGPNTNDIGVAPGATWISTKAFDGGGGGYEEWILEAAQFITAPTKIDGSDPRPELAPDVVNNSWGGPSCGNWFDEVLQTWRAMNVFPAFAAGNSGPYEGSLGGPGDSPHAFAVGATDINDEIAEFSSRGPSCFGETKPEISAPGVDVRSSLPGNSYGEWSGTSMATPHVAGAVALLHNASFGGLSVSETEQLLEETALDLGAPGKDNTFGTGLLQVGEAVQIALTGGTLLGSVKDADGDPLPGAHVKATGLTRTARTTAKSDGSFKLRLPAGAYDLDVTLFGFLPGHEAITMVENETTTTEFTLALAPRHEVSGVVRQAPTGAPLAGARVTVLSTPLDPVTTEVDGSYSIEVPAGVYTFSAFNSGCESGAESVVDALGGPISHDFSLNRKLDAFGYTCSLVPYADARGSSKLDLTGDDATKTVDLPFAFPFYGRTANTVTVSTNGFVSVLDGAGSTPHGAIPSTLRPNGAIYGLWQDLFVRGSARGVYTATTGTAPNRSFVVEFRNFEVSETGDLVNFSIVLGENGTIDTRYRSVEGLGDGGDATIGIEDATGTVALQYALNESVLRDGLTVRYAIDTTVPFIAGVVTNANDGHGVEATIEAGGRSVPSAPNGAYQLATEPGDHDVTISAPGYATAERAVTTIGGSTTALDVALAAPQVTLPGSLTLSSTGVAASAPVPIGNTGGLDLTYEIIERGPGGAPRRLFTDPTGDASTPDITTVAGDIGDDADTLEVSFASQSALYELGGFILLDTDQDPTTGYPPTELFGNAAQDIGFDYFVDVFDVPWYGSVNIWDKNWRYKGTMPVAFGDASIRFDVPLTMVDDPDGKWDITMAVGDYWGPTDWAPDAGHIEHSLVPTTRWVDGSPDEGTVAVGSDVDLTVTANPSGLPAGTHVGQLVVATSDPRTPIARMDVTFTVSDTVAPTSVFDTEDGAVLLPLLGQLIVGSVTDGGTGVGSVEVFFSGTLQEYSEEAELDCTGARDQCTFFVRTPLLPGVYEVNARATDRAGNVEDPGPTISVIV